MSCGSGSVRLGNIEAGGGYEALVANFLYRRSAVTRGLS